VFFGLSDGFYNEMYILTETIKSAVFESSGVVARNCAKVKTPVGKIQTSSRLTSWN